jgi:predicted membrane-bound mannosyltransferase
VKAALVVAGNYFSVAVNVRIVSEAWLSSAAYSGVAVTVADRCRWLDHDDQRHQEQHRKQAVTTVDLMWWPRIVLLIALLIDFFLLAFLAA